MKRWVKIAIIVALALLVLHFWRNSTINLRASQVPTLPVV